MQTNESKTNILIVENDLLTAKNTAKKLFNCGYNILKIVSTGQAAIDCVNLEQPDLVLMEVAIKGELDGIETASQIKSISDVPIIFTTAHPNQETLERAVKTGCYSYLIKPYKEYELQATVKITLSKHLEQSTIQQALQSSILEPQFLELELTETILVEGIKTNVQRLKMLKNLGIQISLDDFGTGYCSLGYLQQFPFDTLKIDACFIRNINQNQVNAVITKTVIEMAHQLGLKVIAEGVETRAELDFLKNVQCDTIQGFLFSRPLAAKEFRKLAMKQMHLSNCTKF
ncbi:MAG: hypothetical protein RLZZ381_2714 [Cyanobacteriota bacterium]|jgi:CheY-like chemotaxis protein